MQGENLSQAKATRAHASAQTLVETDLVLLFGLLSFVGLASFAERSLGLAALQLSPFAAIAFAAIPAILWLGYFYRQDRHQPEPKNDVAVTVVFGALIAAPMSAFVLAHARPHSALNTEILSPLEPRAMVLTFMVIAMAQELAKYLVTRFTIYKSREFDEPIDGVVYASAVGIGFSTYETVAFLRSDSGDVLISIAATHTVIAAIAHASFAGVTGYALARAKFATRSASGRALTLTAGLIVATVLNGSFHLLERTVKSNGFNQAPWRSIAVTAGFAMVVFFVIAALMRTLNSQSDKESSVEEDAT